MTTQKIKFENIPMVVPLLFLAFTQVCSRETSQRMRKRKNSTRTPCVVKQKRDLVTDFQKCCMTM